MQPPIEEAKEEFATKTPSQEKYVEIIKNNHIIFADGAAGCGKTFVATAVGLQMLLGGEYERLIITRPVMEAGESLGFLPGKVNEKFKPYIQPVMDALHKFLTPYEVAQFIQRGKIEIAPIAYMRGRTFDDSFIIVDEAQNCSMKQLKLAVTRLGKNSKIVVNGDVTQADIACHSSYGNALSKHIREFTNNKKEGIAVFKFDVNDIIRNKILIDYLDVIYEDYC
jgi:phosphate starvation-inducible PhoH-like protein